MAYNAKCYGWWIFVKFSEPVNRTPGAPEKSWLNFWATVCKRFALCYQTVVCPVCPVLSVTLVYCGQTVGWIKMKLGMQVGLGPGHIVLDGEPTPPPKKGPQRPIFGRCLL